MRLLSALAALKSVGFAGKVLLAKGLLDKSPRFRNGIVRKSEGICPHICNKPYQTPVSEVHPFVKTLRNGHGLFGRKSQSLKGLLLKEAGDEGRWRIFPCLFLSDLGHLERQAIYL